MNYTFVAKRRYTYKQGRNEGEQRGDISPSAASLQGAESLREAPNDYAWRRKVSTMSQVLSSIQYICFQKTSGSNMGAPNLLLIPGAI